MPQSGEPNAAIVIQSMPRFPRWHMEWYRC